jgi:hypothetical protein
VAIETLSKHEEEQMHLLLGASITDKALANVNVYHVINSFLRWTSD